ncbi:hypothetical protein [Dechloromonas denitrificans]|uniref:hypothetical protein n=1 Tax=Dechloromonas denitrificans TaxID=281362 RepID=UPI0012FA0E2F|nr:hypothetical protein [Dechloromonas denitrificans]
MSWAEEASATINADNTQTVHENKECRMMPPLICKVPNPERQDRAISDASNLIYRLGPALDIRAAVYFDYRSQGNGPDDDLPSVDG